MPTPRDIRRRMMAVRNTSKITQAMRMVSAAKLRRAQDAIWNARPYFKKLNQTLANLVESAGEDYSHPLIQKREIKKVAILVVASDRGMCGSFNSNILRMANHFITKTIGEEYPGAEPVVITAGKRSASFFSRAKLNIYREFSGIFMKLDFHYAKEIAETVSKGFIRGDFDKVLIFYNEFKNLISQVPKLFTLLPIQAESKSDESQVKFNIDYIFEPGREAILDELLPKNLEIQIWRSLLESNAAEQAARMMAMENATNNANTLIKHLELVYNKVRQATITKEMLEIVSGADALKKG